LFASTTRTVDDASPEALAFIADGWERKGSRCSSRQAATREYSAPEIVELQPLDRAASLTSSSGAG
jgi:hypothetical protein